MSTASFAASLPVSRARHRRWHSALNIVCRCRWHVPGLCHRPSPIIKNQNEETCHVDRFRNSGRGQGDPRKGPQMGAGRMHSGGKGTRHQAARRSAGPAAEEGPRAGPVVPVRAEGIWRHGPRPARQRAGADGARRKHARRALDEHAGARRRLDADDPRPRHRVPEGEIPQAAAQRRQAHLLLDDGKGRRRRRHRHADHARSRTATRTTSSTARSGSPLPPASPTWRW